MRGDKQDEKISDQPLHSPTWRGGMETKQKEKTEDHQETTPQEPRDRLPRRPVKPLPQRPMVTGHPPPPPATGLRNAGDVRPHRGGRCLCEADHDGGRGGRRRPPRPPGHPTDDRDDGRPGGGGVPLAAVATTSEPPAAATAAAAAATAGMAAGDARRPTQPPPPRRASSPKAREWIGPVDEGGKSPTLPPQWPRRPCPNLVPRLRGGPGRGGRANVGHPRGSPRA
eukprot:TRINITY_DN3394_c0_g1_i11.p3 TRINITY_DN3394_c0_g1~~TRINITY_DN3394_c0_g1_i11.p3  ORF type:complete len:226 (+),score=19.53 TRINITY_DN3394_c0_g1_i11:574-1251(+)